MAKQLYWEDVKEGGEITPLAKVATTQMLVKWAGGSGDFFPVHYDESFAKSWNYDYRIVHGALKVQWLVQLITSWIGEWGTLKRFDSQVRGVDWPRPMKTPTEPHEGETWWCKGNITKKYVQGDEHLVECDIWVENGKGEKTTTAKATAALPSKG